MRKDLRDLNIALTNVIIENCKHKKNILLTFSGGLDTRLILSIMLANGIRPNLMTWNGSFNDIVISKRISDDEMLNLTIIQKKTNDNGWLTSVNKVLSDYDVIFYGELMSEVFNKFVRFTESENKLNDLISNYFERVKLNKNNEMKNKVMPCLDPEVMRIITDIPICFRVYGYINRNLIRYNYPRLMKFPHTTVNMRYRLMEFCYWIIFPIFLFGYRLRQIRNDTDTKGFLKNE